MRTTRPILTLLPALLLLAACGEQKAAVEEKFNSEFISSFSKACVESIPENTRISSEQKQQVCQCAAEKALEVLTPADIARAISGNIDEATQSKANTAAQPCIAALLQLHQPASAPSTDSH